MRVLLAMFLSLLVSTTNANELLAPRPSMPMESCTQHVPYGTPKSARDATTTICREGYALEHDNKAHIPAWVAYSLTPEQALGCYPRVAHFQPDPSIPDDASARAKDYAKSGYDIGHMANDGDMRWSPQVELESNLFSNAAPQLPGLNRAGWKMLEDQTRAWAVQRGHSLLIYVGPVYEKTAPTTIGKDHVTVPLSFYKIIVDQTTNEVMVFLYPHQDTSAPPSTFQISLAVVQGITQIVFPLPAEVSFSKSVWPSSTKSARFEKVRTCILAQRP